MDKKHQTISHLLARWRGWIQAGATMLTNLHLPNFFKGSLYQGAGKTVCVPGLNCYSCPAASGACPIGAFQAVVGSSKFRFSYYITGFLILLGVLLGRFICGFLCPFGWFQELLHKIPTKKLSTKKLKPLTYLKYAVLLVMVVLLPAFLVNDVGMGDPFFCKYLCPQGVLEGAIPLSLANSGIRAALGKLFLVGEKNLYPDDMKVKRALDTAAVFYPDFDRSYAESLAKQFELPLNKKINGLSTGYGSIFRLILGLSVNTPYVLFDEPVLGLDAQHRDLFYKLLVQKYAEHPCTMVVSTHLIAEVADLIEHTVIIRKGRILQDAPTEELTAACWAVSGPAGVVDSWAAGRDVFTSSVLGGLKTVCIRGGGTEDLPAGLERRCVGLQEYFISLMEEEDQR